MEFFFFKFGSYLIRDGILYLVLCDKIYKTNLARSYIEEISKNFINQHASQIQPEKLKGYDFIKFGKKKKKSFHLF